MCAIGEATSRLPPYLLERNMHAQVLLGTPQVVGGTEVRYFVLVCAPAVGPYSRTMERGNYRRVLLRRRARPTEAEVHDLIALIGDLDQEGVVRKVALIAPVSGFGLLRESLRKVLNQGSSTR